MVRARLAVLVLSAGLCGCVTYCCPPGGLFEYGGFGPGPGPAPACGCGCGCPNGPGEPPLAPGPGPLLNGAGAPVQIGPPVGPPDRLRPQPLAQPLPSPP